MQVLSATQLSCGRMAAFTAGNKRVQTARRAPMVVRAADQEDGQAEVPQRSLDFGPNKRAARGFTAEDSAGQSNIYAIEPRAYVAGSAMDKDDGGANASVLGGAAILGGVLVAVGLLVQDKTPTTAALSDTGSYEALTVLRNKFAAELSPGAVLAAPAVVGE